MLWLGPHATGCIRRLTCYPAGLTPDAAALVAPLIPRPDHLARRRGLTAVPDNIHRVLGGGNAGRLMLGDLRPLAHRAHHYLRAWRLYGT